MDDNKNWILNTNQHITMISAESLKLKTGVMADKKYNTGHILFWNTLKESS